MSSRNAINKSISVHAKYCSTFVFIKYVLTSKLIGHLISLVSISYHIRTIYMYIHIYTFMCTCVFNLRVLSVNLCTEFRRHKTYFHFPSFHKAEISYIVWFLPGGRQGLFPQYSYQHDCSWHGSSRRRISEAIVMTSISRNSAVSASKKLIILQCSINSNHYENKNIHSYPSDIQSIYHRRY